MNDNEPTTPSIQQWLASLGTSWTAMRRYSRKRTALRRKFKQAVYRRQSEPLRVHQKGTRDGSRKQQ
jgi:hypothetical protein